MPKVIHNGVTHAFPDSFSDADIAAALASHTQANLPTPADTAMAGFAAVANIKTPPTLVPGMPKTPSWSGVYHKETEEERRQAAKGQLAIYSNEAKMNPEDTLLPELIARKQMVSTATNPYSVEKAIKPRSVYKRLMTP